MKAVADTVWGYLAWCYLEVAGLLRVIAGRGRRANPGSACKRVLMVSPFPPETHGGVYRPASFAKYAASNGIELSVLTNARRHGGHPAGEHLLAEVQGSVDVDYVACDRRPSWRLFPKVDGGFIDAIQLTWRARQTWRAAPPDVVICSSPPFCLFVAGFWLKRLWGSSLVLDYRDEWSQNPFGFARKSPFDRWWERRCLRMADLVLFTTQSQKALHDELFGEVLRDKTAVVPNGWDESHGVAAEGAAAVEPAQTAVDIVFAGNLAKHTLPGEFLAALHMLRGQDVPPLRLTFVGKRHKDAIREIEDADVNAEVVYEDQIPASEVIARLNRASVVLIIASGDLSRYIPGKLYYYLASDAPVLVYGEPGEVQRIVESTGAGRFVRSGQHDELAAFLKEIAVRAPRIWATPERQHWVASHTREHAAQRLFELIRQL